MESISLTSLAAEKLAEAQQTHSGRAAHTIHGGHMPGIATFVGHRPHLRRFLQVRLCKLTALLRRSRRALWG